MGESDPGMTGKHCSAHWPGLACWVPVLWPRLMGVVREFSHFLIGPACGATSLGCFFSEKKGIFSLHQWVFGFLVTRSLSCPHFLSHFATHTSPCMGPFSAQGCTQTPSSSYPLNDLHLLLLLRLQIE